MEARINFMMGVVFGALVSGIIFFHVGYIVGQNDLKILNRIEVESAISKKE